MLISFKKREIKEKNKKIKNENFGKKSRSLLF
jgi:hypothetical protein